MPAINGGKDPKDHDEASLQQQTGLTMFEQEALIGEMEKLRKFAVRLTKNTHNAEDLLQATLLRALEKVESFQSGTNLFGWASKIMFNLFVSDYRQKKKFETQHDPEPYIDRMSVAPSQEAHVDLVTVKKGMNILSPAHREIILLSCVRGMSYQEIAKMLKIPVGTVRSRLFRARNNLQEILNPALPALQSPPAHVPLAA